MRNNVPTIAVFGGLRSSSVPATPAFRLSVAVFLMPLSLLLMPLDGTAQVSQGQQGTQIDSGPVERPTSEETAEGDTVLPSEMEADSELTDQERNLVTKAVEELSGSEFAERERAASALMELGKKAIPEMQRAMEASDDAETRLRINEVIRQLAEGDMQARIQAFLAGQDVQFTGWPIIQRFLGNSAIIRELFVEIMQQHPHLGEAMEGTTRDRAIALEKTLASVLPKLNTIRDEPNRADLFSLLLVALDPEVPLPAAHEQSILRLCQRRLVTEVRRDNNLTGPFTALMNRWLLRASESNREEVLLVGMEMDLSASLPLAISTVEEVDSIDVIATAFQAISKFGGPQQVSIIEPFLTDTRVVGAPVITDDPTLTQLGDLSMIVIAMLLNVPLDEFGLGGIETHPARGFLLPGKVFTESPSEQRQKCLSQIVALVNGEPAEVEANSPDTTDPAPPPTPTPNAQE